jgi:N-acyl-D-aspartate/D-glutamate deacylase
VLGHFSRDQKLFSLVEAIHRMTGKPAEFFKLKDRGLLRSGAFADIVLFDEHKIIDKATFEQPQQASEGICHVMVNGEFVWRDGPVATSGFGCVLRRSDGPGK